MFEKRIETLTCTCPNCSTTINFHLPQDDIKFLELVNTLTLKDLTCPACGEKLSNDIETAMRSIKKYNDAVNSLKQLISDEIRIG